MHLVRAAVAARHLDQAGAERHLALHDNHRAIAAWFDFQPMHALVRSIIGVLWRDAESALAQFDAIVGASTYATGIDGPWGGLLLRSRAELLLATGASNRARQLIETLLEHADDAVSTVPAALLYLHTGDAESAIATAEDGIYSLHTSLDDRAQLHAVRAAALWLAGDEGAAHAAAAACVVCAEADTLVPFAVLPPVTRSALLARHEVQHGVPDCFLARAVREGGFAGLRAEAAATQDLVRLTPREKVLLPLLAGPATAKEIADQLYVSVNTVRKQVVSLRGKLGASSRAELVRKAHELGLVPRTGPHGVPPGRPTAAPSGPAALDGRPQRRESGYRAGTPQAVRRCANHRRTAGPDPRRTDEYLLIVAPERPESIPSLTPAVGRPSRVFRRPLVISSRTSHRVP